MANLTGQQKQTLHKTILSAFDEEGLRQLLLFDLDKDLNRISSSSKSLSAITTDVIEAAEREGWTARLLCAVAAKRRGRPDVQSLVNQLLETLGATCAPEEPPPWRRWVLPVLGLLVLAVLVGVLLERGASPAAVVTPIATQSVVARAAAELPTETPVPPTKIPTVTSVVTEPTVRPTETLVRPTPTPTASPTATSVPPIATPAATSAPITTENASSVRQSNWLKPYATSPFDAAVSPDGRTLALATFGDVEIYNIEDLKNRLFKFEENPSLRRIAYSPDGRWLAIADYRGAIRLRDMPAGGVEHAILTGHTGAVNDIVFSPDSTRLASASDDHSVRLWDVATGTQQATPFMVHKDSPQSVAFSPDGRTLASGGADGKIRLWDVASGKQREEIITALPGTSALVYSPDGKQLAFGNRFRHGIWLWNTQNRRMSAVLSWHIDGDPTYSGVGSLAFSPDGTLLASGGADNFVRLWSFNRDAPARTKEVAALPGHSDYMNRVLFTPDAGILISSSERDGTIRFWQVNGGAGASN